MKNIFRKHLLKWSSLLLAMMVVGFACKRSFDEPPYQSQDPDIAITTTIRQLQEMRTSNGDKDVVIKDDIVIAGVVIGDDKSGNLYKQIVIQDETAGISIQLDASNLNAKYPAGRRVFVKAKGLTLGAYGGMMQLGLGLSGTSPARIPQSVIGDYLIAGSTNNVVIPLELKISDLADKRYQNMLIKLNDMEIVQTDLSKTYADPSQAISAVNINMQDCSGGSLILRTSSYANFAGVKVPQGKGSITGIFTFFNNTNQFLIRDTTDVAGMTGTRCGEAAAPVTSIAAMRALYKGSDIILASGSVITGTVVSASTNEPNGNFRLAQADNSAGILFYSMTGSPTYQLGTTLTIDASGAKLTSYNGEIELANVPVANVKEVTAAVVTPRVATIQQINSNRSAWSSTLVTVNNVTIAPASGSNYTVTDATGNLVTYLRNSAITMPQGSVTSITGYVGTFLGQGATDTVTQLIIRSAADVVGGTIPPPTGSFQGVYTFTDVKSGTGLTDPTPVPTASGVTFGQFNAVGQSTSQPNASGRFSFTGWPLGGTTDDNFTGQLSETQYYEVTVAPAAGKTINLDSITFTVQRSSSGVRQWAVRSGSDNYKNNLSASISPANSNLSVVTGNIFQVADAATTAQSGSKITLTGLSGLSSAVTFRFYGFNAKQTGGTFSLNRVTFFGKTN